MHVGGEAVDVHEALGAEVVAVEHAVRGGRARRVGGGKVGAGERERGGQGGGVEGAAHRDRVEAHREGGDPALQRAVGRVAGVEQQARAQRADRGDLVGELGGAAGMDGEVEPDPEQPSLAARDPRGEVVGVLGGRLDVRVVQLAVLGGGAAAALELRELGAQPARGGDRVDGFDVHGDVDAAGVGEQRVEPAGVHLTGEPDDGQGRGVLALTDLQVPGADDERVGHESGC